jgi:hypothetical protein
VFLEQIRSDLVPCERDFLRKLLCYPPKDLPKKSPRELLIHDSSASGAAPEPDLSALEQDYLRTIGPTTGFLQSGLCPRLADSDSSAVGAGAQVRPVYR